MSLAHLPDELLINVFERLTLKERHRSLALVSRRCWQLLCNPQLLHTVEVSISGSNDEQAMPRLRSLARFLLKRGPGSVRRLQLDLGRCGCGDDSAAECSALAACAATACSGLEQLDLTCWPIVTLSSWLLPLGGSLRRLRTGSETCTIVAGSLEFLTALQDLELGLASEYVTVGADAALPASLTRLALGNAEGAAVLPPQIGMLPRLQHLHVRHPYMRGESYSPLTRLSLHTLELTGCVTELPHCLSALTTLRALAVDGTQMDDEEEAAVAAGLVAALPHLRQVTRLDLSLVSPQALAALTALSSLRWLCWRYVGEDDAALPPGGWLQQLQTLAAPQALVAASLPALAGAQRLEQLCIYPPMSHADRQLCVLLSWAARHPALQQLLLGDRALGSSMWAEIAAASRLRPSLCIVPEIITHPEF